jgi:transitional endoplasmic reticulum ATPase
LGLKSNSESLFMTVEILLKQVNDNLDKATKAEIQGSLSQAKNFYLIASRKLFDAASQSTGQLKVIRVSNAEKLLTKAKSLRINPASAMLNGRTLSQNDFILKEKPDVTFDDVAGLDNVKGEIRNKIIYPFQYPEEAKRFGIKSGGGILLYGPPGTGKTFIAQAIAHEVDAVFFTVKPSDVMSKWVGESEQNIARLFKEAREQPKSIIFIDELEALVPKRKDSGSTIMQRVVPQILAEMEGVESKKGSVLFIGATNEPWSIDHAALRPGRFDEKIYVPPPDMQARIKMFHLYLNERPLENDINWGKLGELSNGYSGADIKQICLKAALRPFHEVIQKGMQRGINMSDLEEVLKEIRPSVNPAIVQKYEDFQSA